MKWFCYHLVGWWWCWCCCLKILIFWRFYAWNKSNFVWSIVHYFFTILRSFLFTVYYYFWLFFGYKLIYFLFIARKWMNENFVLFIKFSDLLFSFASYLENIVVSCLWYLWYILWPSSSPSFPFSILLLFILIRYVAVWCALCYIWRFYTNW